MVLIYGTTKAAYKTLPNGETATYPMLNIYDSLKAKSYANVKLGNIALYDPVSGSKIGNNYSVETGSEKNVLASFVVNNLWDSVKNVKITMEVQANQGIDITPVKNELDINAMNASSYIDVGPNNVEAMHFKFKVNDNRTDYITVSFKVTYEDTQNKENTGNKDNANNKDNVDNINDYAGNIHEEIFKKTFAIESSQTAQEAQNTNTGDNVVTSRTYDLTAPAKPKTVSDTKAIKIKWKNRKTATGVNIYRARGKKGKYKLIKTVGLLKKGKTAVTSYKDKSAKGGKEYYYKISFVYPDNTESALCKPVPGIKISAIGGMKYVRSSGQLVWKKVSGAKGYNVYVSYGNNKKYKKVSYLGKKKTSISLVKLYGTSTKNIINNLVKSLKADKKLYVKIQAVSGDKKVIAEGSKSIGR